MPFKKKVRGERSSKPKMPKSSSTNDAAAFKRHAGHQQQSVANPAAMSGGAGGKKKKRVSAAVVDEDPAATNGGAAPVAVHMETAPAQQHHASASAGKIKSKSKSKSKHKEVIDYSKQNTHTNTFGKVQKWLLESHATDPASTTSTAAAQIPSTMATETAAGAMPNGAVGRQAMLMSKSQSTPEHLAGKRLGDSATSGAVAAATATVNSHNKPITKVPSVSNLNDKVKLQVVYKPPFKFSLKFSKNSAVKTKVIGAGAAAGSRQKPKQHRSQSHRPDTGEPQHGPSVPATRRTALLVQTLAGDPADDDAVNLVTHLDEPNYETLTPKRDAALHNATASSSPLYENVNLHADAASAATAAAAATPINTATFRISKSASGSSLMQRTAAKSRASTSSSKRPAHSTSQTDLIREQQQQQHDSETPFGSSQNLIRSSTSNLAAKSASRSSHAPSAQQPGSSSQHLSRSSTTNLSKQRRTSGQSRGRGSNPNLYVMDDGNGTGGSSGGSRRNSLARQQSENAASMSRTASHSNLRQATVAASTRPGDNVNNIPRANLSGRQFVSASSNRQSKRAAGSAGKRGAERPHTADCTDGGPTSAVHGFEWPPGLRKSASSHASPHADEPLPSDLEVMVSDVENLVTDET